MSNVVESKKYLATELTRERLMSNRVTLVIGYAAKLVKQMMSNSYYTITNIEEAKSFIAKFSTPLDQLIVVEDLSLLDARGQATFLKFIEESYCPLLLLASDDNILDTILSRCKVVIKVPVDNKYRHDSLEKFITDREQDFTSDNLNNLERDSLLNCPEYYYLYRKYLDNKSVRVINKYIKLL